MRNKILRYASALFLCAVMLVNMIPMQAQAATRKPTQTELKYVSQVFDAAYYQEQNPDVAAVVGSDARRLLNHYVAFGIWEGRNASATFNATTYKDNYVDLQNAFGDNLYAYCRHYIEYGIGEGRNAMDASAPAAAPAPAAPAPVQPGNVIAVYSTEFNANIPRAINVKLAAGQINGKVLQPGETFSFLGSITPRTKENGYVVATVYSGGKVSKGIGGGICQVSSTIYAAVLSTQCRVDERHAHSLGVSYIPKGMDATVSAPSLDFRFTNTYEQPMLLTVDANDQGILTVTISLQ